MTSHAPKAAICRCRSKPGRFFSHSRTVTLGLWNVVVAVDAIVVGKAAEGLVVAGIGEEHVIRDVGSEPLSGLPKIWPCFAMTLQRNGIKSFAARFGSVAPVGLFQCGFIFHFAVFLVHQRFFGAVEDFLPAEAVGHDEDDVLRFVVGRDLGARGSREREGGRDCEGKLDGESGESEKARSWQRRDLK